MTERIMLQPGGAGQMLGCENYVSDGSVLSHSERFSRSECYQGTHEAQNPLYEHLCTFIQGVFRLMGEWCLSERASSAHIIAYLAQQVRVVLRRSSP